MIGFLFKFLCVFYLAVVVNTRTLNSNSETHGKFGDIFSFLSRNKSTEREHKDKRDVKPINNEMDQILANATEKVNNLKEKYGGDRYKTLIPKLDKVIYEYSTQKATTTKSTTFTTTEEVYFLGTEQIEALLNDIKARAIQIVAEQNPSVTDIISNTVTEATFEADPILTHLELSSPGYALSTFVCLNNIENMNIENKRRANDTNIILISNKESKVKSARSVKEDAYTIAQNMEDMLQKELKSIYKKVKNKVSKDFHKEVKKAKSTLKCESSKIIDTVTKKVTGATKVTHLTNKATSAPRHNRGFKTTKPMTKSTKQLETTTNTPTVDDFAMLTLYEQILAKTHEDNVMKMLTTNTKRKTDETIRLSKRNPETLTDLTLKEDMKRINDDGEGIPNIDYNDDIIIPETPSDYSSDLDTNDSTADSLQITQTTEALENTSFEGLSDKISYKDFVNGYKNYLNFQRDQANQNFSALVKYQAHRHHKVDDIGKFILNKIPQIPQRRKRYFFDDSDIDEQDISTKSDDSWFKKHFYMFIDNGPPKKYHTSETVEFKDVTEASRAGYLADNIERPGLKLSNSPKLEGIRDGKQQSTYIDSDEAQTADINLDELSNVLENAKISATGVPLSKDNEDKVEGGGLAFQVYAPHILNKLFGKGSRTYAKENQLNNANTLKYDDDDSFLFNSDLDRSKRNAKKQIKINKKQENNHLAHTPILKKQDNVKLDKTKGNEKVGCVSIVPQPTAIVNLHKANAKGSKIKRLLSKLHFRKRNKKLKKEKRHCTRVQRFNPIKKLKNMFMPRQGGKGMAPNNNAVEDYDMITSHIDTFKPVKYDQIPSIDALRNQVPNISGDIAPNENMLADELDYKLLKDDTTKKSKTPSDIDTYVEVKNYPLFMTNTPSILQTPKMQPKVKSYTKKQSDQNIKCSVGVTTDKRILGVTDDLMNVNVKTVHNLDDLFAPVTLDNMRTETDKILTKYSTEADLNDSSTSSKNSINIKSNENTIKGYDKELNDDITIKAKLTRVVKYPLISRLKYKDNINEINPVGDNTKLYEFIDSKNDLNAHEESSPYQRTPFFNIKYSTNAKNSAVLLKPQIELPLDNLENEKEISCALKSHKTYPDYFHDLVMWNSDILNYEKVSNPTWQDILKNIKTDQEYTTPNLRIMQKELNEMKEHLLNNNLSQIDCKENAECRKGTDQNLLNNIKIAVTSNKMTNYPTVEHFDEDSYNVPRNYPNKYANVKAQNIIEVLNKLYTKKPNRITIASNSENKRQNSEGPSKRITEKYRAEQLGTTRMTSYTDEQNFLSDRWFPKKVSKNSIKSSSREHKEPHLISKVNKQPKQYYNTPLPMQNEQFEKFLRANQLDVDSVTLPMIEIPTITETWHSNDYPLTKTIETSTVSTTKVSDNKETSKVDYRNGIKEFIDTSYPENQIEYLNDLENDLLNDYRNNVNVRQKRSGMHDYDTLTDNILRGKEKILKLKNKVNDVIFYVNSEESTDMVDLNPMSSPNENDVQITIINFDDKDKKAGYNKPGTTINEHALLKVNSSIEDNTKKITSMDTSDLQTKEASETKNQQFQNNEETVNINNYALPKFKDDSEVNGKITSKHFNQLPIELSVKCKDKQGNLPKRVQISSQTYKYDVLYNVPDIKDSALSKNGDMDARTQAFASNTKRYGDNDGKESTNSEIHQIMIVLDVVNAVDDFTRPDISIHLDLPTYYAPKPEIDSTNLLPVSLKTSWTDLVLKYISGIALIEMLNKLGVLKGGLNLTDGLDLNLDRDKVLNKDGVMSDVRISRVDRADFPAMTTKKRYTFSQTIHYTREMKKRRNKRLFKLLPVIKEKLKLFNKNTTLMMATAKKKKNKISLKSLKVNATDMKTNNGTTNEAEFTKRKERNFKDLDNSHYDIFDYKGDIDDTTNANKNVSQIIHPIIIITNKQVDNNKIAHIDSEGVYMEEYDDGVYYEDKSNKSAKKTKTTRLDKITKENKKEVTNFNTYNKLKRDVSHETFTAKDVAALEVIVDLMKNTPNNQEKNLLKMFSHNNFIAAQHTKPRNNKNEKMDHTTNSIQVHIAIPYDVPDKRRSLDYIKVRKVFSAKLATPVDLEYQINSIEDNVATTAVNPPDLDYGLSPGMYLLVEDANTIKGSFTLKPVKGPSLQLRSIDEVTDKLKSATKSDKVKLSKEFVAAVNKHLIQLYENMTANENENQTHRVERRETSWERVRKLFGHDRVCNCKCKENKTMCRACAASDAVINELTFEFDNLAKYMSDHCTEIQTFFWMNPIGGRKLRDSVHRIDKSLNDYYKRVKGKCRGRTCKTFATYIDKRNLDKNKKIGRNYTGESLVDDLKSLGTMFDISSNFIPYDETLKEKGAEFVRTASNCLISKAMSKRSSIHNKIKQSNDKNDVYTLDNIKVNIICSPDVSGDSTNGSPINLVQSSVTGSENNNILLDYDFNKRNCGKYKIKNQFGRSKLLLNKLFTYYNTQVTAADTFKREAKYEQIESPIIADTGGSFWHDYLRKGNVDVSNDNSKPNVEILIVQTKNDKTSSTQASIKTTESLKDNKNINKKVTILTTTKSKFPKPLTDSLSYNMNELFKLIGTIKDVEEVRNTFTDPTIVATKRKTKKIKTKKRKKNHKSPKSKMHHKHKTETTKMTTDKLDTPTNTYDTSSTSTNIDKTAKLNEIKLTTEMPKTTETLDSFSIEEITASLDGTEHTKHQSTTTKKNLFNKIKMATLGFLSKIGKVNYVHDSKTTKAETDGIQKTAGYTKKSMINDQKSSILDSNVISEVTTKSNPTILIINEDNTHFTKEKSKYKSILLSLINYESGQLNKEKNILNNEVFEKGIAEANLVENISQEDVDGIERALIDLKMQSKFKSTKPPHQDNDYDVFQALKTMGPELEIPAPPGLHSQPGMLEKMAHKFGIKVLTEKVVEKPNLKSITQSPFGTFKTTKKKKSKIKRAHVEEAGPMKASKIDVIQNKRQSNGLRTIDRGVDRRKYLRQSKISHERSKNCENLRNKEENTKTTEDSGRINERTFALKTTQKSRENIRKFEFDTFIREENGIYRLKRNKDTKKSTYDKITETSKRYKDYMLQNTRAIKVTYKSHKRKHKRSYYSGDGMRKNIRLSMWRHYNIGFFIATTTCLYIVFALCAVVVNWLFRR